MVTSSLSGEYELDYDVNYRELASTTVDRDMTSRDKFRAKARFGRHSGRGGKVNGAHRRRDKRNYL